MFVDRLRDIAERNPTRPALVSRDRRLSYGELMTRVDRCAGGLTGLGLGESNVVGLTVGDEIEHLVACLALMAAGTTQITLSTFDPPQANADLALAAGVDLVLGDDAALAPPGLKLVRWGDVVETRAPRASSRHGRLLLRTSGTTGVGKIVPFDEPQLALQARLLDHYENQRYLRPASVEHNNGKRHRLYCLFAGGTNAFRPPTDPDLVGACSTLDVSLLDLSLMHAETLLRRTTGTTLQDVAILTAGSALPYRMRRALQEQVSRHLYVRYGATECGTIAIAGPDQHDEDEVVGTPVDDVDVRVVDDNGADVAGNVSGRIGIRAPGMATRYLNAPDEAAKRFVDGWFYPGDVGHYRPDGLLIVEGRADEMMILNGLNIFPQEIERVLQLHPAVRAAAAVALSSAVHGQIPVAAVELEAGRSADPFQLMDFARDRLGLRSPRRIIIVDKLPRAAEGKILRRAILTMIEPIA